MVGDYLEVKNVDEQGQLFWQPARVVELCEDGAFIACINGEYNDQFSPEMDEWRWVPASERARVATAYVDGARANAEAAAARAAAAQAQLTEAEAEARAATRSTEVANLSSKFYRLVSPDGWLHFVPIDPGKQQLSLKHLCDTHKGVIRGCMEVTMSRHNACAAQGEQWVSCRPNGSSRSPAPTACTDPYRRLRRPSGLHVAVQLRLTG